MLLPPLFALAIATTTSTVPTIELITMGPGPELYSFWGHAAIRVIDPIAGTDLAYNYGSVDFSGDFFVRMMRGQVDAFLGVSPFERMLKSYVDEDRTVTRRTLALAPRARVEIARVLGGSRGPKTSYRYHHFDDNCSTRVADVIEAAAGAPIFPGRDDWTDITFRDAAVGILAPHPLTAVGVDLALAGAVDQPITERQLLFLPKYLEVAADAVPNLVSERVELHRGPESTEPRPPWLVIDLLLGLPLVLLILARPRSGGTIAGLGIGTIGAALFVLWLGTSYDFVARNWNVLVLPPTHLALPWLVRRPGLGARYAGWALGLTAALAGLWGLGVISQSIAGPLSFVAPIHIALWLRLRNAAK